jgi:hypothetical protein
MCVREAAAVAAAERLREQVCWISEKTDSNFVPHSQELHRVAMTSSLSIGRCLGIKDASPANNPHSRKSLQEPNSNMK